MNDTYGHLTGDAVLKQVAGQTMLLAAGKGFAARYGGEEFAILYMGLEEDEVYRNVEEIREAVAAASYAELEGRGVTISVGLHRLHTSETKDMLFKKTDEALYAAKHSGKNRTVFI
ncbi:MULTISPECIES: GGDEF domain-containing protein [unclassified Paenibacillus]|uniref:GGDEF domain-containing protein n=1 Tax=Paenibacillus sp. cl123 TaxID=1761875 RepID=UPI00210B66E0|nr:MULTISPECIES: GGDEF domain-containing protein [unclassified Paenibacillus]